MVFIPGGYCQRWLTNSCSQNPIEAKNFLRFLLVKHQNATIVINIFVICQEQHRTKKKMKEILACWQYFQTSTSNHKIHKIRWQSKGSVQAGKLQQWILTYEYDRNVEVQCRGGWINFQDCSKLWNVQQKIYCTVQYGSETLMKVDKLKEI